MVLIPAVETSAQCVTNRIKTITNFKEFGNLNFFAYGPYKYQHKRKVRTEITLFFLRDLKSPAGGNERKETREYKNVQYILKILIIEVIHFRF